MAKKKEKTLKEIVEKLNLGDKFTVNGKTYEIINDEWDQPVSEIIEPIELQKLLGKDKLKIGKKEITVKAIKVKDLAKCMNVLFINIDKSALDGSKMFFNFITDNKEIVDYLMSEYVLLNGKPTSLDELSELDIDLDDVGRIIKLIARVSD